MDSALEYATHRLGIRCRGCERPQNQLQANNQRARKWCGYPWGMNMSASDVYSGRRRVSSLRQSPGAADAPLFGVWIVIELFLQFPQRRKSHWWIRNSMRTRNMMIRQDILQWETRTLQSHVTTWDMISRTTVSRAQVVISLVTQAAATGYCIAQSSCASVNASTKQPRLRNGKEPGPGREPSQPSKEVRISGPLTADADDVRGSRGQETL
ncbi:hypothetical protein BJ912DRAFT_958580 [Pholiota molesta]|nr:hypothetical protein BJ912DRAFT_958580 [Pholiota molesta]